MVRVGVYRFVQLSINSSSVLHARRSDVQSRETRRRKMRSVPPRLSDNQLSRWIDSEDPTLMGRI